MDFYLDEDCVEKSVCHDCKYRIRRVFIPKNYEEYGINLDDIEELREDELVLLVSNICIITDSDLGDHTVLQCNNYASRSHKSPFGNKFL